MSPFSILDAYSLRARLLPAGLASAPLLVTIGILLPRHPLSGTHAMAGVLISLILFMAADLARRAGKNIEFVFYKKWDGKPTTRMLRHRDRTLDAKTKAAYLTFLADKIGSSPPDAQAEDNDPAMADAYYERCGAWLRENTRSAKKFAVLFGENVTYGYRRNLLALKKMSLAADLLLLVGASIAFVFLLPAFDSDLSVKLLTIAAIAIIHGILLSIAVSEKSLKEASEIYARQLLLSCETLATAPARPARRVRKVNAAA